MFLFRYYFTRHVDKSLWVVAVRLPSHGGGVMIQVSAIEYYSREITALTRSCWPRTTTPTVVLRAALISQGQQSRRESRNRGESEYYHCDRL